MLTIDVETWYLHLRNVWQSSIVVSFWWTETRRSCCCCKWPVDYFTSLSPLFTSEIGCSFRSKQYKRTSTRFVMDCEKIDLVESFVLSAQWRPHSILRRWCYRRIVRIPLFSKRCAYLNWIFKILNWNRLISTFAFIIRQKEMNNTINCKNIFIIFHCFIVLIFFSNVLESEFDSVHSHLKRFLRQGILTECGLSALREFFAWLP